MYVVSPISSSNSHSLSTFKMPSKMATCCSEKSVVVAVYVEKPKSSKVHHHNHHHHHKHRHGGGGGGGRNRKAELLDYSNRLRNSAQSSLPTSPLLRNRQNSSHLNHQQKPIITQIMRVKSNPRNAKRPACFGNARGPTCLGNWKIAVPNFLRKISQSRKDKEMSKKITSAQSTSTKAKAIMKSFQGKKKNGFVSKIFAAIQKHR